MGAERAWVSYRCACGFRLARVPREIVDDLPRCLGCGRSLRGGAPSARAMVDVRDLR